MILWSSFQLACAFGAGEKARARTFSQRHVLAFLRKNAQHQMLGEMSSERKRYREMV